MAITYSTLNRLGYLQKGDFEMEHAVQFCNNRHEATSYSIMTKLS